MQINGHLEVLGHTSIKLIQENDYTFLSDDAGFIFLNPITGSLQYNDGNAVRTIQTTTGESDPLVNTLGDNWINPNLTFNPTPFNNFDNISGLDSNDSLFAVLNQFDSKFTELFTNGYFDITDVITDLISETGLDTNNNILFFDGETVSPTSINNLPGYNNTFEGLNDVDIENIVDFHFITYEDNSFINIKLRHIYETLTPSTNHLINHDLGQRFCTLTVINLNTETITNDYTVNFTDVNSLTITTESSIPLHVIVSRV